MDAQEITERLHSTLNRRGFRSSLVSASHVPELRLAMEENLRSGLINEAVYQQYAVYFDNMLSQDVSWARSIIAVAVPRPRLKAVFTINGEKHTTIIPPTYEHSVDETLTAMVERGLTPHGYQVTRGVLPQKLLAARSGLARYGKNNIAYVEEAGSFHRLLAYLTDLPTVNDAWQDPEVLDECTGCSACTQKCPTGAIDPDQFRLHAERCLTLHNESADAFPSWIDDSWHHCLIGCMKCQHFCPVNKSIRSWTERFSEFTEEESALIMSGTVADELPPSLIAKFKHTDLLEDPISLARNLRSVLAAAG